MGSQAARTVEITAADIEEMQERLLRHWGEHYGPLQSPVIYSIKTHGGWLAWAVSNRAQLAPCYSTESRKWVQKKALEDFRAAYGPCVQPFAFENLYSLPLDLDDDTVAEGAGSADQPSANFLITRDVDLAVVKALPSVDTITENAAIVERLEKAVEEMNARAIRSQRRYRYGEAFNAGRTGLALTNLGINIIDRAVLKALSDVLSGKGE